MASHSLPSLYRKLRLGGILVRIAFCLEYPIGQAGGVSVLVLTLLREFAAEEKCVLVSPDTPESLDAAGLAHLVKQHITWSPGRASAETAAALADAIARSGIELAHFHFGGNFGWNNRHPARCPIPPLARRGVPIVTTIHMAVGLLHGYCGPQKPFLVKLGLLPFAWFHKLRVLRHIRREITVSRQDYQRLCCWYWPMRGKFFHIYHSRIRSGDVPPVAREKVILAVGHIAQRKGQLVLAEAFLRVAADHPDWKLMLAGHAAEPETCQRLQALATRTPRPGQIELLGQRDDAETLMQRAAIYVQPSFHEGLPLSLQEALHQGCACVATRIPGNIELVEHDHTGRLVPPGDAASLADTLKQLMADADLRSRLAAAGHAAVLAKGMNIAAMTRQHRELYAAVLAAR